MRVGFLATYPPTRCGVAEYTRFLVEALKKHSDAEVVVFSDDQSEPLERTDDLGVKVVPCFTPGKVDYSRLLDALDRYGELDVLHVQHEYGLFPPRDEFIEAMREAKKECRNIIVTLHTVYHSSRGADVVEYQRKLCDVFDAVIVHSVLQEYELWSQGADLRKVHRIPHGTWIPQLNGIGKDEALEKLGLGSLRGRFIFSSVGFVRWDKGPDVLVRAFEIVHKRRPDTALVIAGAPQGLEGEEMAKKLKEMIAPEAGENIFFIQRYLTRDEIALLLKASDVVVFAYREKLGVIGVSGIFHLTIGAMRPVICVRIPRLVECSICAPEVMVAEGDVEGLAEKMLYAIENYEDLVEKCKPLYDLALETSWDRVALKHLELYEYLRAQRP